MDLHLRTFWCRNVFCGNDCIDSDDNNGCIDDDDDDDDDDDGDKDEDKDDD